jgi:hypothetical protein
MDACIRCAAALVALAVATSPARAACPPPNAEVCDGVDNDGDTFVDEIDDPDAGEWRLCPLFRLCVTAPGVKAQCAEPVGSGDFSCATGMKVIHAGIMTSGTGKPVSGSFCFALDECGGCYGEHCDDQSMPVCGPEPLPPCVCHEQGRCANACSGVTCPTGYACRERNPGIGTCQPNGDCRIAGGCAPGELCLGGACRTDPCATNPCTNDQVCRGTSQGVSCETSCASVRCDPDAVCIGGSCIQAGSRCEGASDAGVCPPLTVCRPDFVCGDPPCLGVRCPERQHCVEGQCRWTVSPSDAGRAADVSTTPTSTDAAYSPGGPNLSPVTEGETSGCGCSVLGRKIADPWLGAIFTGLLCASIRRRRTMTGRRDEHAGDL